MQSLKAFQSVFKVEPVRIEYAEFAKDGAIAQSVKALKAEGLDCIWLMPLTSEHRAGFEASIVGADGKQRNMSNLYARYVALCWVNDEGKPMGTAKEIGQLRADLVAEIFEKVQLLNGVKTDAVAEAGKD
jgi:hypothetical protein